MDTVFSDTYLWERILASMDPVAICRAAPTCKAAYMAARHLARYVLPNTPPSFANEFLVTPDSIEHARSAFQWGARYFRFAPHRYGDDGQWVLDALRTLSTLPCKGMVFAPRPICLGIACLQFDRAAVELLKTAPCRLTLQSLVIKFASSAMPVLDLVDMQALLTLRVVCTPARVRPPSSVKFLHVYAIDGPPPTALCDVSAAVDGDQALCILQSPCLRTARLTVTSALVSPGLLLPTLDTLWLKTKASSAVRLDAPRMRRITVRSVGVLRMSLVTPASLANVYIDCPPGSVLDLAGSTVESLVVSLDPDVDDAHVVQNAVAAGMVVYCYSIRALIAFADSLTFVPGSCVLVRMSLGGHCQFAPDYEASLARSHGLRPVLTSRYFSSGIDCFMYRMDPLME